MQRTLFHETIDAPSTDGGIYHDYRYGAINGYFNLIDRGSPGAIVRLPTGCGKTIVGSLIADRWTQRSDDHRVLVVAHERQLVTQFRNEIEDVLGIPVGLEMAEDGRVEFVSASAPRIVVASRATLYEDAKGNSRLYKFDPSKHWLLLVD